MNTVRQRASTMSPDSPALSIARANSRSSGCSGSGELAEPSDIAVGYPALPASDRKISTHAGKLPTDGVCGVYETGAPQPCLHGRNAPVDGLRDGAARKPKVRGDPRALSSIPEGDQSNRNAQGLGHAELQRYRRRRHAPATAACRHRSRVQPNRKGLPASAVQLDAAGSSWGTALNAVTRLRAHAAEPIVFGVVAVTPTCAGMVAIERPGVARARPASLVCGRVGHARSVSLTSRSR